MCMSKEAQEGQLEKAFALQSLTNSDETTWDALPDSIWEQILCQLPGAHLHVARAVCRRWRRLLASYLLYPVRQVDDSGAHWCGWDGAAARWRLFRLPSRRECHWRASARGLVLSGTGCHFTVCNPVTAAFRELPDLSFREVLRPMQNRVPVRLIAMVSEFNLDVGADGRGYAVRVLVTGAPADPDPTGLPTRREYPWLVEYRRGAPDWDAVWTGGGGQDEEAAPFRPLGRLVVAGGEMFVVGSVGREWPARVMALDLETKAWRVAVGRGVRFTDVLLVSCGRVFLVREEEELEEVAHMHDGAVAASAAACEQEEELLLSGYSVAAAAAAAAAGRGKTFVVYSVGGAADTDGEVGLVVESRCDSGLWPQHPHISEPGMWYVVELAGSVYITCGSVEEPAHHAGVVYDVASKVWRKWCGGHTWPDRSFEPSATKCFEWGMVTAP